MYMYLCLLHVCVGAAEARRGGWIMWNWSHRRLWTVRQVLGTGLEFPTKVIGTFHCWAISLFSPWVSCNNTDPVSILIYYFCLKLFTISNTLCKLTRNLFRLFSPTFCVSLRVCACFCPCVDYVCACFCLCAHACEGQRSKSENCPQLLFHLIYWGRVSRAQWFG